VKAQSITVREAFDRHAGAYDERFSSQGLAREIRSDIWRIADTVFPQGARLIDAGCGTGEDAIHFAQRHCAVTALDISPEMIAKAQAKARGFTLSDRIEFRVADIEHYAPESGAYDGIFSNFGALNCLSDLSAVRGIAERGLKPGAHVVLVTMGRFYPLEFLTYLLTGKPAKAIRRFKRPAEAVIEGVRVPVFYHAPRAIARALGAAFELKTIVGLRTLLPVPGFQHLERYALMRILRPVDRMLSSFRITASWADHFISVWRRVP
jgi:ubiquinone/menaquinone biosynthesis C-methylase UbiE